MQKPKPIVIEVSGEPQGVVVPSNDGFRFLAVRFPVFAIDGQTFSSVQEARLAASSALAARKAGSAGPAAA